MLGLFALPRRDDNAQLLAALVYGKHLQAYQASLLLVRWGMIGEARGMVRLCAEACIALAGVAEIPNFHLELIADRDQHAARYVGAIFDDARMAAAFDPKDLERLKALAAEIGAEVSSCAS